MNRVVGGILVTIGVATSSFAIPVTFFEDSDAFVERAKDIVVAECTSIPVHGTVFDGLREVEVNVLRTLKGHAKPGHFRIATIYAMKPGVKYMLYSMGGKAFETDFVATAELSVVPLPTRFEVDELEGKALKEQVQCMFARRLYEVERELAPLLREKELLEKAVSDRAHEWYESDGPVEIGPITEVSTQTDASHIVWLDIAGRKLEWSHSAPGKTGYFYFEKVSTARTSYWEFSPCDLARIEDLDGQPLKARFYGQHTPGRRDTPLGWTGEQSLGVKVGQVLLARTADDPREVFVIQIEGQEQDQDQERMSARYAVIRH